jgi:hypothetical protein
MSEYKIIPYTEKLCSQWNDFVEQSNNGTIFHRLDFLNYHKEKFKNNLKNLIVLKGDKIYSILPMAVFESDSKKTAKSPFGASYGGFIFKKTPNYNTSKEIIKKFIEYCIQDGINEVIITPTIDIYHKNYCETFLFAMLESGFKISNSDITSIVDLEDPDIENNIFSSKIRNIVRKARKEKLKIVANSNINDFWEVMDITFNKIGKNPTHTIEELIYLNQEFPTSIFCDTAYYEDKPIAGIGYFKINNLVNMSFYLCKDNKYQMMQALSLLVYEGILKSKENGFRYFDFGTSSSNMIGNDNIFMFKESFGAIGRFRNTYKLEIR